MATRLEAEGIHKESPYVERRPDDFLFIDALELP